MVRLNEMLGLLRDATSPEAIARHTKVIISLIHFPVFLNEIALLLISKSAWRCLVDFCLAKGAVLADSEKAACYEYLFEHLGECLEFVIGSTDHFFLNSLYRYCIDNFKSLDRVLLTDSETLLKFMTAHDRAELWKFHRVRRDYSAASLSTRRPTRSFFLRSGSISSKKQPRSPSLAKGSHRQRGPP
jgi:hypothetical protein